MKGIFFDYFVFKIMFNVKFYEKSNIIKKCETACYKYNFLNR